MKIDIISRFTKGTVRNKDYFAVLINEALWKQNVLPRVLYKNKSFNKQNVLKTLCFTEHTVQKHILLGSFGFWKYDVVTERNIHKHGLLSSF